jgi:hypothetical protein
MCDPETFDFETYAGHVTGPGFSRSLVTFSYELLGTS